jgi:ketosteroid isomerase-like protein
MFRFYAVLILSFFWIIPTQTSAQDTTLSKEVHRTIENLLEALGNHDFDTLEDLFTNNAILIVARQRDGKFRNTVQTAEEWLQGMRENPGARFEEKLANIEITIDGGELAYLRADFEIVRDGKVVSHGVDLFTLLRSGDGWKVAAISYTNFPGGKR